MRSAIFRVVVGWRVVLHYYRESADAVISHADVGVQEGILNTVLA